MSIIKYLNPTRYPADSNAARMQALCIVVMVMGVVTVIARMA